MRLSIGLFLWWIICPFAALIAPTATPPAPTVPAPHVEISATAQTLKVGDTVTITGAPVSIGLPYYTLTLTSGATVTVTYDDQVRASTSDGLFEVVEARGEMNAATFTLRALAPGSADAVIGATGEVRTPEGAYMWGNGSSAALRLTVTE